MPIEQYDKKLNKKLRSAAALLSKVRHWIPEEHYLKMYHALFESHLTYGISVWGGVSDSKLNKIFIVQKQFYLVTVNHNLKNSRPVLEGVKN